MTAAVYRPPLPCGLLVSVRSPAEARAAVLGGAAIVDVKEPLAGPLGRAAPVVAAEIGRVVGDSAAWTLACGEWNDGVETIRDHLATLRGLLGELPPPVAIKAGLAGLAGRPWRQALTAFAAEPWTTVAVVYADWERAAAPAAEDVIDAAAAAGCGGVLVDTWDKSGPGLLGCRSGSAIAGWVSRARAGGMQVALAGRIAAAELPAVLGIGPDIVGLRTAVCAGGRLGHVDEKLVRQVGRLVEGRQVEIPVGPPGEHS
jgi:uncharacterized protein (UPF0264 family)